MAVNGHWSPLAAELQGKRVDAEENCSHPRRARPGGAMFGHYMRRQSTLFPSSRAARPRPRGPEAGGTRGEAVGPLVVVKHRSTAAGAVGAFVAWAVQSTQYPVSPRPAAENALNTLSPLSPPRGEGRQSLAGPGEKLWHQALLVRLERGEPVDYGDNPGVEGGEAVGDSSARRCSPISEKFSAGRAGVQGGVLLKCSTQSLSSEIPPQTPSTVLSSAGPTIPAS